MLIQHDKRVEEEEDDNDIAADIPELCMDETIIDIRNWPVNQSYVGGDNIMQSNVEVESEWAVLSAKLIEDHMDCFWKNRIEW
jgi:hypothetical protein